VLFRSFPILAIIWVGCGILMFVVAKISYKRDRERVRN